MEEMHLGRMESIGVWFPLVLKWDALVSISCCLAHPMLPRITTDITNDITITPDLLVLAKYFIRILIAADHSKITQGVAGICRDGLKWVQHSSESTR